MYVFTVIYCKFSFFRLEKEKITVHLTRLKCPSSKVVLCSRFNWPLLFIVNLCRISYWLKGSWEVSLKQMTSNDKPYYIRASRDKQDTAFLKYDIKTTLQEVIIPKGLKCSKRVDDVTRDPSRTRYRKSSTAIRLLNLTWIGCGAGGIKRCLDFTETK